MTLFIREASDERKLIFDDAKIQSANKICVPIVICFHRYHVQPLRLPAFFFKALAYQNEKMNIVPRRNGELKI